MKQTFDGYFSHWSSELLNSLKRFSPSPFKCVISRPGCTLSAAQQEQDELSNQGIVTYSIFCSNKRSAVWKENIVGWILTDKNLQMDHGLSNSSKSWSEPPAVVRPSIIECDRVYDQWTRLCNTQSVGSICGVNSNLPCSNQLYCCCSLWTGEEPVSIFTSVLRICHIFTRQNGCFSMCYTKMTVLPGQCCWKDDRI